MPRMYIINRIACNLLDSLRAGGLGGGNREITLWGFDSLGFRGFSGLRGFRVWGVWGLGF